MILSGSRAGVKAFPWCPSTLCTLGAVKGALCLGAPRGLPHHLLASETPVDPPDAVSMATPSLPTARLKKQVFSLIFLEVCRHQGAVWEEMRPFGSAEGPCLSLPAAPRFRGLRSYYRCVVILPRAASGHLCCGGGVLSPLFFSWAKGTCPGAGLVRGQVRLRRSKWHLRP